MTQQRNRRAGVEDRWRRADGTPSANDGSGKRWRARYVDEHGREHARGFARKIDAQQWLDSIIAAQVTGNYVDPRLGKITYTSFYREWSQRQTWVHHTRRSMDLAASEVPFGDVALSDLRRSHVESWVKQLVDRGLAPRTVHQRVSNVKSVLKAARRDRVMAGDPADGVTLPRLRRAELAMEIPTPGQVGALLVNADPDFAAYIAACAFAGLRRSEAAALQPGDVDFLRQRLNVSRQAIGISRGVVDVRAPKYGSERSIPVPAGLLEVFSEHIRVHMAGKPSDAWMFPDESGDPINGNRVFNRWRRARNAAGVGVNLHSLRHYFASGLIAAGCDVVTVQRAMGHSAASITLDTYSHLWPNADDRTRQAAASMFDEATGATADALRTDGAK